MHNQNIINRDSKLISNNLGKCCLLALSMRGRASVDHNIATLLNSDTGALVETNRRGALGPYAANLDIGGEANAHQLALSTFLGLFCTQIIVVRQIQGFIQSGLVIAGIINRSCNRLVGELVRLDEVESAYLSRVLAQFVCHKVYCPLCDVGRLWTSRPTISIRRNFIREDDIATEVYVGNVIAPTRHRET